MKPAIRFGIVAFLLLATIGFTRFLSTSRPTSLLQDLAEFPRTIGGFAMIDEQTFDSKVIANAGMDHYIMRQYQDRAGYRLSLYIGYYESQTEGDIIHSPKHCMPGSGWQTIETTSRQIMTAGHEYTVNRMLLQKNLEKELVHFWYQSRGRVVASEYLDRAYMILDSLLRRRSDGALVRIIGPASTMEDAARKQEEFIKDLFPELARFLPS